MRDPDAFPDPVLTANVYCAGRLDAAVFHSIVPFWRELRQHDPGRLCYLWLMRYGKGGEHLKVRLHGPEPLRPLLRQLLAEKVNAFLAALPAPVERPAKGQREKAPPIDAEDDVAGDHPDGSLLWTTYRRSPIALGGKPFLSEDGYVARFTRCLAAGCCDLVLALEPGAGGLLTAAVRQRTLLQAVITGLAAAGFPSEMRAGYLAYHRDWLLRSALPVDLRARAEPVAELCRRFDLQVAAMGESLAALRRVAEAQWNGAGVEARSRESGTGADWRQSLAGLVEHVTPLCADPDYRLDPFASDPVFAPVFKVFHGLANQLGLKRMDEAFVHHTLLHIAASGEQP